MSVINLRREAQRRNEPRAQYTTFWYVIGSTLVFGIASLVVGWIIYR